MTRDARVDKANTPDGGGENYVLKLYIAGATPHSMKAVNNIRHICAMYLPATLLLEIIDIYQQPRLAKSKDIIAVPTLIKESPLPVRRLVGDLSDTRAVLLLLGADTEESR